MQSGDVILDVAGKVVSNPSGVTKDLADLHEAGKHTVLMRVKSGNGTKFVALPPTGHVPSRRAATSLRPNRRR
jgi:serine protease Do